VLAALGYRCGRLLASRRARFFAAAFTLGAFALVWLPLLTPPGYELASALSVWVALFSYPFGIGMMRREKQQPNPQPLAALLATVSMALSCLAPALLTACVKTWATTPCSAFFAAHYFVLLLVPSVVVTSAIAVLIGALTERWRSAFAVVVLVVLLSAGQTLYPIVFGPQVFAYNHLAGFLPGPLYDEVLQVPSGLYWFQLTTLLWAAVCIFATLALVTKQGWWRPLLLGVAALGLEADGVNLGFRSSDEVVAESLGASVKRGSLVVHFPAEYDENQRALLLDDVSFRFQQVSSFLGETSPANDAASQLVTVWVYRSAQEKQRLVGAAATQFAKPWRHEIHINAMPFPHPVVKHELVHAMAAVWSPQLFRVPTNWLVPHVGLIEGLAVAADNPVDDLTLTQWAAAMKKKTLLPDVSTLMQPQGFYRAPPSRAYTTAGAFLRFLHERFGAAKLRTLYAQGDFEVAYGRPLDALAREFEQYLDNVTIDVSAMNQAFARFSKGSLFDRTCAREVVGLEASLASASAGEALTTYQAMMRLQPNELSHAWGLSSSLQRLHRDDEAQDILLEVLKRSEGAAQSKAETLLRLAEHSKNPTASREWLDAALSLEPSAPVTRTALVRRLALDSAAPVARAVDSYFERSDGAAVLTLSEALREGPGEPTLSYLLGRKLFQSGAYEGAMHPLQVASRHPNQAITREAARLWVEAAYQAGHCERVAPFVEQLEADESALKNRLADFVARCEFRSARR
jgi:tetratricopeptide (TPR) repeat protein